MTEATTRFYFNTPAQMVDTGTERLPCRRFGKGSPLLLVDRGGECGAGVSEAGG
jgi:hypothetical protein